MKLFKNRVTAGKHLAKHLTQYKNHKDTLVFGMARGGVPVAYQVAKALSLPLDVCIVRKLGVPENPELAMGAIASDDVQVLDNKLIQRLGISQNQVKKIYKQEKKELARRERAYRGSNEYNIKNKTVILVDDGIATGASVQAAIRLFQQKKVKRIIVAAPVAARDTYNKLVSVVDEVVCIHTPTLFGGVGQWYQDFDQVSDKEVKNYCTSEVGR